MPAVYNKSSVHFQYPDNWELADERDDSGQHSISVHAPSGAFWSVTVHDRRIVPDDLIAQVNTILSKEYEEFEARPVTETIGPAEAIGFDMHFFCGHALVSARSRVLHRGEQTVLILCQAEDTEFDQLAMVFQAITFSMLQESE
jgi:hypothetical protein